MSNLRIRTTPGGDDKYVTLNINQNFDFIEILSLKLRQDDVYRRFCSDYGAVVGRVLVNNGLGVPNAKVSIFIPIDDIDKENSQLFGLYPYEQVTDTNSEGFRYNLLPKTNNTKNECFTTIGSFPTKREVQDNDDMLYLYSKYYKFTTTTNQSGDYMFFGVPVGTHQLQVDADLSDIGILSVKPYNLIGEGYNERLFDGPLKFKQDNNLNLLAQVKGNSPISVNVLPFWGDIEQCQVGITRMDVDLNVKIKPHAIFMGSVMTDNEKNSLNYSCRPRSNVGKLSELVPSTGTIEMIRKTPEGNIERFDINGGNLIDENGTWLYTIPMNLDYVYTNEFGDLVPTDDQNKGIPTRARVRFRIKIDDTGDEGKLRRRAAYLVPHNPDGPITVDYRFDENTSDDHFEDLYWNKIYTVANHITRVQKNNSNTYNKNFLGIKGLAEETSNNPFPYNKINEKENPLSFAFGLIGRYIINLFVDADSLIAPNIVDLQFYNDWINGTLYFYQFRYKRGTGTSFNYSNKFCNTTWGYSGVRALDNCTDCKPQEYSENSVNGNNIDNSRITEKFERGLIREEQSEDELYYVPKSQTGFVGGFGSQYSTKLYATKIVNLGSILDCDWQGSPVFYKYLTDSTFQIPPEEKETFDGGPFDGDTEVNGYEPTLVDSGWLGGATVTTINCNNVKRICELGVGLDEDRRDPITQQGTPANGSIGNEDVERAKVRGLFRYLNTPNATTFPSVTFDSNGVWNYAHPPYSSFRGYDVLTDNTKIWFFKNSFYFYFGLVPGKTALSRLTNEYLGKC